MNKYIVQKKEKKTKVNNKKIFVYFPKTLPI